jgi:hypothetical protein
MPKECLAVQAFDTKLFGVKAVLDQTSLSIPDGTPFEVTERMLATLKQLQNCTKFWIGDLLVFSERAYGEKYSQLLDSTDYEYGTLCNISYTAEHVSPAVRRKELTFWHHQEVAALKPDEQKKFLKIAVDQRLTASALRALIKNKAPSEKPKKVETFELALKSILKICAANKEFDKKALSERPPKPSDILAIAITANDALRAFEE